MKTAKIVLAAGLVLLALVAPSLQGQVLKTGQTNCYDINGNQITCAGTGQDGDLQVGVAQSYTDNGDGTITDNVTGLMWERLDALTFAGNPSDIHDAGNKYTTWASAFQKIGDLNTASFAGYTDWRLPNVNELHSLIFFGRLGPAVVASAFYNGTDSFTYPTGEPVYATGVSFTVGGTLDCLKTSATCFVRAVRGPVLTPTAGVLKTGQAQCWDSSGTLISCAGTGQDGESQIGIARSYTDNGNGTITDNGTGLVWEQLENTNGGVNLSDPHDVDNNYTDWNLAFQKVTALNFADFAGDNDWRMPNIKELESLKDYGKLGPTIDVAFNNGTDSFTQPSGYWSSTTSLTIAFFAYGESFLQVSGTFPTLNKSNPFANGSVRAVRGHGPVLAVIVPPSMISTTASGLLYSRVSKTFTGTVTITSISPVPINGPLEVAFASLPSGVTLVNATGAYNGTPYITVPSLATLAPAQSVTINVQFSDPSLVTIDFTPVIYSGSLN